MPLAHAAGQEASAPAPSAGGADPGIQAITDVQVNSPKETLRKKLFEGALDKPTCSALSVDPRGKVDDLDVELSKFLQELIAAVRQKKDLALQPLFHRRLNISLPAIAETFAKQEIMLGGPFEVSIHRLWAFNTVDGSPGKLTCEKDALSAYPLYGYPLQFGLWLSVLGKNELGRIYVGIVPADGRWNIGSFHTQQWTHAGRDAEAWAKEGLKAAQAGHRVAAFTKLDIAAKLVDGGGFLDLGIRSELESARDGQMSREERDKAVRSALKEHDLAHVATLLVLDGAGLLLRVRVPGEISLDDMKKRCAGLGRKLLEQAWSAELAGVRCSFLMPKESPQKDGGLGGMYVSFADLRK